MGFNTGIVILNDCLHEIECDPTGFTKSLVDAITMARGPYVTTRVLGQTQVVHQAHADAIGVIAIGGNCGKHLGYVHNCVNDGTDESAIEIIKELAAQRGYRLVKKGQRKRKR